MISKIVGISDTHNKHNKLIIPECDLLIHCGDYSFKGYDSEVKNFYHWLNKQPARHKISIQGNHEVYVQNNFEHSKQIALSECPDVHFVTHDLIEIEGLRIFCSSWTPEFHMWAYNAARYQKEAERLRIPYIKDKWNQIPNDIDILACHGPVHGIHDQVYYVDGVTPKERVGCWHLGEKLQQTTAKIFMCGHIHSGNGYREFNGKKYYNVSNCGETYSIDYPPTEIEID